MDNMATMKYLTFFFIFFPFLSFPKSLLYYFKIHIFERLRNTDKIKIAHLLFFKKYFAVNFFF